MRWEGLVSLYLLPHIFLMGGINMEINETRDDLNTVIWECEKCQSIIKTKEDANLSMCSSCKSPSLKRIGMNYSSEREEKSIEILKDPELFNNITEKEFSKKIVGEIGSRKVIFLCGAGGRLVENCQVASYNVLVNDDAGAGKDYVTGKVLELLPKEAYVHKTRISPTVFTYWHNKEYEPEWTWDGKVFYPEDISEIVLNSDVFKVMCSSGSSATVTIRQKAVDIEIDGKPVMITTTATATPNPELVRRFVILNLDSSVDQTKAIMKKHCEDAKTGIVQEYNKDYTYAMRMLKRVKVRIPFADLLSEVLPSKSIIMRTHLPRFLDYIKASTGFHQYQRKEEGDFILATGQDYDIARECFIKLTSNRYMIPLTINQKKILEAFSTNPDKKYSNSQFHAEHNFISERSMLTNLGLLAKYGILESSVGRDRYDRDVTVYSLSGSYDKNEILNLPSFDELCRISSVSSVSEVSSVSSVSSVSEKKQKDAEDTEDAEPDLCRNNPAIDQNFEELKEQISGKLIK